MTSRTNPFRGLWLLAALLLVPCTARAVEIVQGPTLTMNPNNTTPLAGVVELETDAPVQVELTITGGSDVWTVSFPHVKQVHQLPVLGLKPDRSYTVDVELIPGGFAGSVLAVTDPLPSDFPVLLTTVSDPAEMEPGFTLFCIGRENGNPLPRYSIIVDAAGEVVWYSTICGGAMRQLPHGNLMSIQSGIIYEWDMLGEQKLVLYLNTTADLHHDHLRTAMGTYLSLARESVQVPDYPTSYTDPDAPTELATVLDEPVIEFFPNGLLRDQWLLTELIDPTRIGYDSLVPKPNGLDWAHSNGVIHDPSDDSLIVSVRHQDAVVKFSRATRDLVWILGPHDNWPPEYQPFLLTPVGSPFRWQFHQHAPMITGDGTIVMFDNGNHRASPFDGNPQTADADNSSRGVEYEVDEDAMEVRQIWEYEETFADRVYSGSLGDADWLETTGNVLMTFGAVKFVGGASSASVGLGTAHARFVEATDDPVPNKVFELVAYDAEGGRITAYRSERIPDLYPQQYVSVPNGVDETLRVGKSWDAIQVHWTTPPVDPTHSAADYFELFASSWPGNGFKLKDTSSGTSVLYTSTSVKEFYMVVAVNSAGPSEVEPN